MDMMPQFLKMLLIQHRCSDFDSDHPTCIWLIKHQKLDAIQALWLTFLVMAFYNEASAWIAFNNSDPFITPRDCKLPIDKNRRNLYGEKIVWHLDHLCREYHSHEDWPYHEFSIDKKSNWDSLREALRVVWGNGRFAVYNTADMLHKVNGAKVTIHDLENKSSSGPADAIARISGCGKKDIKQLNIEGEKIYNRAKNLSRPRYCATDMGTVESVLCNFSGMCRGKFYAGRNIDRQQDRIIRLEKVSPEYKKLLAPFWEARQAVFHSEHLGENNNWVGVNNPRKQHFAKTGVILEPSEGRDD